jgi:O-antigen/teichoic acid export membrane protein
LNPIKKLLGQTAIYGLPSILGRLLNYLLVPLHTKVIDPEKYGVVSELYAWVAFLIVILTFGMETSFFKFLHEKEDREEVFRNSFLTVIGINIAFFAIMIFFNQNIADAMLYSDHNEYIILLGIIVGIDAITALPLAKLRAEEKAFKFATIQFSSILVNIALNLVFMLYLFDPKRPEEGVLFILIANLCASLVNFTTETMSHRDLILVLEQTYQI